MLQMGCCRRLDQSSVGRRTPTRPGSRSVGRFAAERAAVSIGVGRVLVLAVPARHAPHGTSSSPSPTPSPLKSSHADRPTFAVRCVTNSCHLGAR